MTSKVIALKNNGAFFYFMIASIVFASAFYMYCVNASVRNTVGREQLRDKISSIQTSMSELEYRLMNVENKMTIEYARQIGLNEPKSRIFISRDTFSAPLSLNNR